MEAEGKERASERETERERERETNVRVSEKRGFKLLIGEIMRLVGSRG